MMRPPKDNIRGINDCALLNNGLEMPWLGLGVFKVKDGREVEDAANESTSARTWPTSISEMKTRLAQLFLVYSALLASHALAADTPHGATAIEESIVVEVFSPVRRDYLP